MADYTDDMPHTATYWALTGVDGFNKPTYANPVTLACRWQNKAELVRTPEGREVVSASVIYPEYEVLVGGCLALGDQTATADPQTLAAANEIISVGSSPDLDDDYTLWKAWL